MHKSNILIPLIIKAAIRQYFGTSVGREMMGIIRGDRTTRGRGVTVVPLYFGMPKAGRPNGQPILYSNASWWNIWSIFNDVEFSPNPAVTFGHEIAHLYWPGFPHVVTGLGLDRFGVTSQKYAISQENRVRAELCIAKRGDS